MFMNTTYSLYFNFAANMKMNTVQMRRLMRELKYVDVSNNVVSTCRSTMSSPDFFMYTVNSYNLLEKKNIEVVLIFFFQTMTFCCESTCEILIDPAVHCNYPHEAHIDW